MSKLKPKATASTPKCRAWGPCFVIICEDNGACYNQYIHAVDEPTRDEIEAMAGRTVWAYINAYRRKFHWEPFREPVMQFGSLRGLAALAEAKRRILDDPVDSVGKRFLLKDEKLRKSFDLPKSVGEPIKTTATRKDLEAIDEPWEQG